MFPRAYETQEEEDDLIIAIFTFLPLTIAFFAGIFFFISGMMGCCRKSSKSEVVAKGPVDKTSELELVDRPPSD